MTDYYKMAHGDLISEIKRKQHLVDVYADDARAMRGEIERLKAVVDAARNVSVARPGTMAEALNEMINALAALDTVDEKGQDHD